jgi:hypothetical protein
VSTRGILSFSSENTQLHHNKQSRKNKEALKISFIRIEKSPFHYEEKTARLTLPQEAIERTKLGKTEQTNEEH